MKVEYGSGPGDEGAEVRGQVVLPCPCGNALCEGVIETNHRYVCQRLLDGLEKLGPVLPRTVCSRTIEIDEATAYFGEAGRTEVMDGFLSKKNRNFSALLYRRESGKHGYEFPPRPGQAEGAPGARRGRPRADADAAAKAPSTRRAAGAAAKKGSKKTDDIATEAAPKAKRTSKKTDDTATEAAPKAKRTSKKAADTATEAAPKAKRTSKKAADTATEAAPPAKKPAKKATSKAAAKKKKPPVKKKAAAASAPDADVPAAAKPARSGRRAAEPATEP
jgi:hypothetical protein